MGSLYDWRRRGKQIRGFLAPGGAVPCHHMRFIYSRLGAPVGAGFTSKRLKLCKDRLLGRQRRRGAADDCADLSARVASAGMKVNQLAAVIMDKLGWLVGSSRRARGLRHGPRGVRMKDSLHELGLLTLRRQFAPWSVHDAATRPHSRLVQS